MRTLTFLTLSVLLASCTERAVQADPGWGEVIQGHLERYPDMELDDLYKLLHQGATGSEHAVASVTGAREWLADELTTLDGGPREPLVDTIAPGGTHVRVHLRAFMESGGDPEALLRAFVQTANNPPESADGLGGALDAALQMTREGTLPWDIARVEARFAALEAAGYPAVHHSTAFTDRYRPAYRVVSGTLLIDLLPPR
jgi:hypothetical protein